MNFRDYIKEKKVITNEKPITHISHYGGGKFSINLAENENFLKKYLDYFYMCDENDELIKMYMTECILPGKLFNLMLDIEIKEEFRKNQDLTDDFIIENVAPELLLGLEDITGSNKIIFTARSKYLYHIYVKNYKVGINKAKQIADDLRVFMRNKFRDIVWEKAIDSAIYAGGKGLRMLGSYSNKETKKGEKPYYEVYDLQNKKYIPLCLEHLKDTIIRTEDTDQSIDCATYNPDFVRNEEDIYNYNDVVLDYVSSIKENFPNNCLEVSKIKKVFIGDSSNPVIFIQLKDRFCPFKNGSHKRKSEHLYLTLNKHGCCLKCFDEDCASYREPNDKLIPLNLQMKQTFFEDKIQEEDLIDIPEGYELTEDLIERIEAAFSHTHYDVAELMFFLYKDYFRVDSFKHPIWYEFKQHRFWKNSNKLQLALSSDLVWYLRNYKKQINSGKSETIDKLITLLKTSSYKNNIMSELSNIFFYHDTNFLQKMDADINLFCFKNGILNTETLEFREGRVEDCVTLCCGNNYIEYDPENQKVKEVFKFLKDIFQDEEVLEYQINKIAFCLSGRNQEHFNIWTGNGCFGKGTLIKLFDGKLVPVETITFGNILLGDDLTPRKVLDVFRGQDILYEITFFSGEKIIVNQEHKLVLKQNKQEKHVIVKMKDFNFQGHFYSYKNKLFQIKSIKNLGIGDYYGFEVSGNHLFLGEHDWILSNSNGKSKLCDLIKRAFGQYWNETPVSLITKTRNSSSNASPEVMDLKGRRITTIQEPEFKDKLNMGLIKQLTGGDTISARQLHKEQEKFNLQTKLFLCCNTIPKIESSDGGTWRRIKIVEFKSKFVDNPKLSHEKEKDEELDKKIQTWGEAFLSILVHYYKNLVLSGGKIKEPKEVKKFTDDFRKDSDIFAQFVDDILEEDKEQLVSIQQIHTAFTEWCQSKGISNISLYNKTEIKKLIGDIYGVEKKFMREGKIVSGYQILIKTQEEELDI